MRNKKGYSILEMVLTLAIVSGVAYAVLSYYRSEKKDRAIRENAQQIETIFKASDSYLISLRSDGSNQDRNKISMQILKNMNALPINLGSFTQQEIPVDTLPAAQAPEPETNEGSNQAEEPEIVPETPSTPETPIVDNVSFPDEWLKSDPVVVVDNPAPVEPTPETPVETTPEPSIPVEPVEDDTTTGAVEKEIDEALSKDSYFLWSDGGLDGYQISIVMKLADGDLTVLPGNNYVNLTPFLDSGTPYLNYHEKISNMVAQTAKNTSIYSYEIECSKVSNSYYDKCAYTSDYSYLNFTIYNAFNVPVGLTIEKASSTLINYWMNNKLSSLKSEVNNNADACIIPNVKTRTLLIGYLNDRTYRRYELATDGVLYSVSFSASYLSCNTNSNRTITKVGDYW
ncbi:hypothetical protein M9782_17360 [Pectobacterium actinidiae]|uniref:hypothetical protein n=1 Tax=Pectobacterium actinidiae TaxID=1507808 RepID=UPI0023AAF894|nr:hypothetical protein [Pectobacterium actinidiae]WEF10944.1 hypothetical protein M9782_17360 [Pectobacterium actinidiae]